MININNKGYNNLDKKITWGKFSVSNITDGIKTRREGEAPFIEFIIDDNIFIGLETTYPKDWLIELKIGTKVDFSNYLSDITYEDHKRWQSLISEEKYKCELLKKDDKIYNIKLNVESTEFEKIIIKIDEDIIFL